MAAMFFLSGLFVWPSLQRKGIGWFLRDRWWRLGLPYIVCVLLLMPFAYWAIELELHNPNTTFAEFWWRTVTVGPWNSGPAWFVWVLLALDVIAALVYYAIPGWVEAIGKLSLESFGRPALFFWALLIASIILYVPAVLYFGASTAGSRLARSRSRPAGSCSICCISSPAAASAPPASIADCLHPMARWRGAGRCGWAPRSQAMAASSR